MGERTKFNVGDRVVRINHGNESLGLLVGMRGVVTKITTKALVLYDDKPESCGSFFSNLELEEVYDSPLNKAMNEN